VGNTTDDIYTSCSKTTNI